MTKVVLIKETVLMGGLSQKHKTAVHDTKALSYDEPTHINSAFAPQLKWNGTDLLQKRRCASLQLQQGSPPLLHHHQGLL